MVSDSGGVALAPCAVDLLEIAAFRGGASELKGIARRGDFELAAPGRVAAGTSDLSLCVRPGRWLLLLPPDSPGAHAARWQTACAGVAAVVDRSSGLAAMYLAGAQAPEVLSRGCRLDLDRRVFPPGHAAASIVAQVPMILARLPAGLLILTPASTAQHVREWLASVAGPLGLVPAPDVTVTELSAEETG